MTTAAGCYTCLQNAGFDSALPGWLVLLPRRHVTAVADLTDGEAAALGTWQVRLSRALHAVTGCAMPDAFSGRR